MDLSSFVLSLLRHGPNIMLYPGAFEPKPRSALLPSTWGLKFENLTLVTSDKVNLHAYMLPQPDAKLKPRKTAYDYILEDEVRPTIIMFHGNCDSIGFTLPLAQIFVQRMRCNVLMLSPRGYGLSSGKPSTKGFQRDADAALNYVCTHPKLRHTPIVLFGQSMGASFAIDLAGRHSDKIAAMIIENTFTSLRRLIPDIMPAFSITAPFFRQWNSLRTMKKLDPHVKLLMLSGAKDEIIPPRHMRELWSAACGLEAEDLADTDTTRRSGESVAPVPNATRKQDISRKEPAKWSKLHLDLLAKLRLRTHRRQESVASSVVPKESVSPAPVIADASSMERAKSRLASEAGEVRNNDRGNAREGKFVSVAAGMHNDTWDDPAYWDAIEIFLEELVGSISARPSSASDGRSSSHSFDRTKSVNDPAPSATKCEVASNSPIDPKVEDVKNDEVSDMQKVRSESNDIDGGETASARKGVAEGDGRKNGTDAEEAAGKDEEGT